MIDTLKLARELEGGPFDRAKAEAVATAIGEHVTDLGIVELKRDTAVLKALVGVNLALTLAVLAAVIGVFSMLVSMEHRLTVLEDGQQLVIGLLKARP